MRLNPIRQPEKPPLELNKFTVDEMSKIMGVLTHPSRLKLLLEIQAFPYSTRGQLADKIQQQPRQVTHLLRSLKAAHMISHHKTGRSMHFAIADPHIDAILDFLSPLIKREDDAPAP